MSDLFGLKKALAIHRDPAKAVFYPSFFKAIPGGYGEGDRFLGIVVPKIRQVAKLYKGLDLVSLGELCKSPWHEERLCAFIILSYQFARADEDLQESIYSLVLENLAFVNNWDLVDLVAPKIIGPYLFRRDSSILYVWARSDSLWLRRISVMSTFHFIRNDDFVETLALAEYLLWDEADLIHKAVGWMLREVGSRSMVRLRQFLRVHGGDMPRTMLRYAIEKMDSAERKKWLKM